MTDTMVHRGPDSDGYFHRADLSIGIRRLKIIDLETGDQPIFNEEKKIALVCNGEIYNFKELREELTRIGHNFSSKSDTEVIIHAYEQWGVNCLKYLRGMFAIAIVDFRDELNVQLILARDRFGIKPLYYWHQGNSLIFASEVKAILSSGVVPNRLSNAGLYTYLSFGSVQEPLTMIEDVASLPPATFLVVNTANLCNKISPDRYWEPSPETQGSPSLTEMRSWLTDAISSHMVSDVPLGSFLSGGIDSGSLVAFASQIRGGGIKTFTLGFSDWSENESELADLTAEQWHTSHHSSIIDVTDVVRSLPVVLDDMDQPTVDGINTWFVSREARRSGLAVALSGIGGDELFAGYPSFSLLPILSKIPHLPKSTAWLNDLWIFGRILGPKAVPFYKILSYLTGDQFINHAYFTVRGLFTNHQIENLLKPRIRNQLKSDESLNGWKNLVEMDISTASLMDPIASVSWLELSQYMKSTLLRDTDMMSMAHSLEVRVPFLDHLLVEQILAVSSELKSNKKKPKALLSSISEGFLPPEVIQQKKKTFTFPFQNWLKEKLRPQVEISLNKPSEIILDLVDPNAMQLVWNYFVKGQTNWSRPWALYILDEWCKRNL